MFQRDYLLRAIEQAAQAVARALKLLIKQKEPEEATQALMEGYGALSLDRELLLLLDGPAARNLVGGEDRLEMAVRLLLADADIRLAKHEQSAARRCFKAARRLLAEHSAPPPELSAELARVAAIVQPAEAP